MDRVVPAALVAAACVTVLPAFGQVKTVDPVKMVTKEKAFLRCGEGENFYKVGEIPAGTALTMDGEADAWARVTYPSTLSVFVKAEEVDVQGTTAKLTKASRLVAVNVATGFSGSWKALLAQPLASGTELKVIETIKEGEGPIVAYRVAPPEQARAFVEARLLKKVEGEAPKPAEPAPKPATGTPAAPATTPAAAPAATPAKPDEKPAGTNLAEPMKTPATPATTPAAPITTINQTPAPQPTTPPAATPVAVPRPVNEWADLDRTFKTVWRQPMMEAELDELLAEHERSLAKVDPNDNRIQSQIQGRISALKLRIDLRNKAREQDAAKAAMEANRGAVNEQLSLAEKGRVYTIVGQLQPSTVYDGQKLPLMYRVVSVGPTAPKTLGYLKDDEQFKFKGRIGAVVGVIGDAQLDRSLMLNIITPVRVDVLRPTTEAPPAPPAAAPTAPATTTPPPAAADAESPKEN
ncbi:MAG: hypothetical protein JSR77_00195 [Planctomycetes bacterium]|nr:hypothetical protein [Planctomycetota bacterium]